MALELTFSGTTDGHIFFVGAPRYDPKTDQLYVPDLDYDPKVEALGVHAGLRSVVVRASADGTVRLDIRQSGK